jgi:DNA-binding response OmpR family regulator
MRVLIVEDDERIASFLVKGLKAEGYASAVARDGDEGLAIGEAEGDDLDMVLLDLGLPGTDGRTVLRVLRERHPALPVIILTARDDVESKVRGLDAGAADYVTKPFHFEELLARIRAALRTRDQASSSVLVVGDLRLDLGTKVAWRDNRRIDLAPREWALLELLMRHPHQVLSRAQILDRVWEYDFDPGSNIVDVYVGYLRRKLNAPGCPPLVQTVRGAGYRLLPPTRRGTGSARASVDPQGRGDRDGPGPCRSAGPRGVRALLPPAPRGLRALLPLAATAALHPGRVQDAEPQGDHEQRPDLVPVQLGQRHAERVHQQVVRADGQDDQAQEDRPGVDPASFLHALCLPPPHVGSLAIGAARRMMGAWPVRQ